MALNRDPYSPFASKWIRPLLLLFCLSGCTVVDPASFTRRGMLVHIWECSGREAGRAPSQFNEKERFLFERTVARDIEGAKEAIRGGADPSAADEEGQTLFEITVRENIPEMLEHLTELGLTPVGGDALHYAITLDRRGMLETLLRRGANPNQLSRDGSTPLITAIRRGDPEIVTLLVDHGAKILFPDSRSVYPLDVIGKRDNFGFFPDKDYNYDRIEEIILSQKR